LKKELISSEDGRGQNIHKPATYLLLLIKLSNQL